MTSFGWKRKRELPGSSAAAFSEDKVEEETEDLTVDWLSAAKKRKAILLEDSQTKSKRLQDEGSFLAEHERYWEAIKHWDEAIQLTPGHAPLHEMKAQVRNLVVGCFLQRVCSRELIGEALGERLILSLILAKLCEKIVLHCVF